MNEQICFCLSSLVHKNIKNLENFFNLHKSLNPFLQNLNLHRSPFFRNDPAFNVIHVTKSLFMTDCFRSRCRDFAIVQLKMLNYGRKS